MPNKAPRARLERKGSHLSISSPSIAPHTPVITTKIAVRSGTPPMSPDTAIANGVVIERGNRLKRMLSESPKAVAIAQALRMAMLLPTTTPMHRIGQWRRISARCS